MDDPARERRYESMRPPEGRSAGSGELRGERQPIESAVSQNYGVATPVAEADRSIGQSGAASSASVSP